MNIKQRRIILAGIILIALMLLIPPWKFYGGRDAGYGLLFYPYPTIRAPLAPAEGVKVQPVYKKTPNDVELYIDVWRLLVQCAFVAVVTGGFAFLFQSRKN